jgi:signal transduction histidine kinase
MSELIRRHSLVFRLLALTAAAAMLPALLIGLVFRSISSKALLESIQQQQTELARRLAEEVNNEIRVAKGMVALLARSSFFSAGSRVDQYEALRNLLREAPAFQEAMFVGPMGEELLKVSQRATAPHLVRRFEDLRQSYIGPPFFSGNRAPTILLGEPIRSFANPRRTGAVVTKMSFTTLGELMRQARVGPRGVAFIVDSKGTLLAHPEDKLVFAHTSLARRSVVQAWLAKPQEPTGLTHEVDDQGLELLSLAYPIPLLNSAVVIEQPRADVYAALERMRDQFIVWTLVSVLVFMSLAVAVAWRILKPLRKLRAAAEQVGRGQREVHLDIHTRDELEELGTAFEQMTKSLAELEGFRRDLISMIVHDLKMPLSTILPSLDSLLAGDLGKLPPEQARFVQMARRSGHEMLMLIQNLLDVAKMEEGKLSLHKELFAPADWAQSVVSNFKPLAEAAQKQLDLVIGGDLAPVEGDEALLGRVLGNLISNALRHTAPATGEVTVSLFRNGNQLAVEVRDNGEGIPEQELNRIFEKFVQGASPPAHMRSGTGLGLTFCKMVVEAHGGQIRVFSQPHSGSVFTVSLPLHVVKSTPPKIAVYPTD